METKSPRHSDINTFENFFPCCYLAAIIVYCFVTAGCSSESQKPLKPIEKEVATNVVLSLRQSEQPAASNTFRRMEPIELTLDFDYDPAFDWDSVVLRLLCEPTNKHPDGVAWTTWLGGRQLGTRIVRDTHHWNYDAAWGRKLPTNQLGSRPGEYVLQISLDRYAETVEEKLAEQEDPALFLRPIWQQSITVIEQANEPETAEGSAIAEDIEKR